MASQQQTFRPDPEPNRPNHWFLCDAQKAFVSLEMVKEMGPMSFAVFCFLLTKEHGWGYRKLPHYSERQLAKEIGFERGSRTALKTAINKLIEAGWLQRIEGRSQKHGDWYRVILPLWAESQPGLEASGSNSSTNRTKQQPVEESSGSNSSLNQTTTTPNSNQPISHPYPNPITPSPPPPNAWREVEEMMFKVGIQETTEPIESLKREQVPPELALQCLQHAARLKAWNPGKIRLRLKNLRPGHDAAAYWPTPDRAPVTFADESRTRSADEASRQREDKKRPQVNHKQLELDFGDKIDAMTSEDRLQLLTSHPNYATVAAVARQLGPDSKLVRPLLLEAFAATYQQN